MARAIRFLDTADGRFQIGLGHRRLSIIDIGGGQQPMSSADGRFTVTFNGEIYNYIELREELLALGHRFRTTSDTEVLIEAYRAWDLEAIRRFRGMFAFALWDAETQRLVLARDAFGKKPLFLADAAGGASVRLRDRAARSVPRLRPRPSMPKRSAIISSIATFQVLPRSFAR